MPQNYYLVTNSTDVFYYGLLEDGQQISTGLPTSLSYGSESALAQALGTITGNPLYYYENVDESQELPSFIGPDISTLTTTNGKYEISAGNYLQTWKVTGTDLDYLQGATVDIEEAQFIITGIFSILESYEFNQTETIFQLVSPNSFLPYRFYGLEGLTGKLVITPSSAVGSDFNYLYFTGLSVQNDLDPTFQYFRMQGNLDGFNGSTVLVRGLPSEIVGVLEVVEPYDSGSNITLCKLDSEYQFTDYTSNLILTIDPTQTLPPNLIEYRGSGRTVFQDPDASIQYFDIYEDFQQLSLGGSINVKISENTSVSGTILEAYFWGEELTPVTRIYVETISGPAPYQDSGTLVSWRAE